VKAAFAARRLCFRITDVPLSGRGREWSLASEDLS
jgi:hypothetical protein